MKLRATTLSCLALAVALATGACGWFDNPTPEQVFLRIDGEAGAPVELHISTNFVAGIDETGTTRIQAFSLDTIRTTLPVDTVIDIVIQRRFFMQLLSRTGGELAVDVEIDIDEDREYDQRGVVSPDPDDIFQWVYVFNQRTTLVIELI